MGLAGRVVNQARYIIGAAGQFIGYKNPITDEDVDSVGLTSAQAAAVAIGGLSADSSASATTNTGLIQARATQTGLISINTPGTIWVNDTLTLYSRSRVVLGPNTTLKQTDGISKPMFQNANKASTGITVSSQITCGSIVGTGFAIATADCGANAHGLAVGKYALIKGDTSRQYNGVVQVLSTPTAFTFTFLVCTKTSYTISTGTVTVREADYDIVIEGGTLDYNGYNNPYVTGVRAQAILLNNVGNVRVQNTTVLNVTKWMTNIGNVHGCYIGNIELYTGSDGPHLCGNSHNVVIENIRGTCGDDMIALQGDPVNFVASEAIAGGDQIGAFENVVIRDIVCQRTSENVVALYPTANYGMQNVRVDGAYALDSCKSIVYMTGYTGDVITNVERVSFANLAARRCTDAPVKIGGNPTSFAIDKIEIDGLSYGPSVQNTVGIVSVTKTQVAKSIELNRVNVTFDVSSIASQNVLQLTDSTCAVGGQIKITNFEGNAVGGAASAKLISVTPDIAVDAVFSHIKLTGLFSSWNNAGNTQKVTLRFDTYSSNYFIVASSNANTVEVVLGPNVLMGTPGGTAPVSLTGTSKTYIVKVMGADFGNASNWLACGTSSTYHLEIGAVLGDQGSGVPGISYGTTNTFFFASRDPRFTIKTDTAGHTFTPRTGSIYNDTQAATPGIYLKGPAAGAARIAT